MMIMIEKLLQIAKKNKEKIVYKIENDEIRKITSSDSEYKSASL